MKKSKKTIVITLLVIVALIATGIQIFAGSKGKSKEVDMATVTKSDLIESISVTGNIEARDMEQITLSSLQKVTEVLASEGQMVKKGDILAKVDITDSSYQLKKAQLNYDVARIALDKLVNQQTDKQSLQNAVRQAEINLQNAQSSYDTAKESYDQSTVLFQSEAISQQEYDSAKRTMDSAENALKLASIQLDNAKNSLNDFGTNHSDQLTQQRKQVEAAKADIENLKSKVDNGLVKANVDGKVVKMSLKKDQYPSQDTNTISIYDLSQYKLIVNVSQYDAVRITPGQKAKIKVKGLDKEYTGSVSKIGDAAELTMTGNNKEAKVAVEIIISNPDDKVKAGYEADADIILQESKAALSVNFESVLTDKDGKRYIFAVEKDKAVKRYITVGVETDFDLQILDGLKEGDKYVTNPPGTLKDGDLVKASGGKNSDNKN